MNETLSWQDGIGGSLLLLDQTKLPHTVSQIKCTQPNHVYDAIKRLSVRGAPAIGCAAAYGVCLSINGNEDHIPIDKVIKTCRKLAESRPTAVNLFWALDRMQRVARNSTSLTPQEFAHKLLKEAKTIHEEDKQMCDQIGKNGAALLDYLPVDCNILTHCNAGALATGGEGTALSVIFELAKRGKNPHVWVDETRPLLQGARLTTWELKQRGIKHTLICDSMVARVMSENRVNVVITGADRIAANGDVANKIGTQGVAILADYYEIPFYVAAPTSTIDTSITTGGDIPIEQRDGTEITTSFDFDIAPTNTVAYNPAFDITPNHLIAKIITEIK